MLPGSFRTGESNPAQPRSFELAVGLCLMRGGYVTDTPVRRAYGSVRLLLHSILLKGAENEVLELNNEED